VNRNDAARARVKVRVTPGTRQDAVLGWQGEILRVRVRARAQGGQANEAVCRLLAITLGLPAAAVAIAHGARSRDKLVEVAGLKESDLRRLITDQA
jgi:uncharacterized protein YggU (UPF0235/DUF167 family)